MTIITVFRSRLRDGVEVEYQLVADSTSQLVMTIPGFIDQKHYVANDGERVTVVRFDGIEHQQRWALHLEHLVAQRRGR
jgi:antibiotic biosynthesis monooxygenase (ABM) superfamily enzyme